MVDLQCYNVVLVSGVQPSDSVIHIHILFNFKKLFWAFQGLSFIMYIPSYTLAVKKTKQHRVSFGLSEVIQTTRT